MDFTFDAEDEGNFDLKALSNGIQIGYAHGDLEGDRLHLLDLKVEEVAPPGMTFPAGSALRGRRIGSELLAEYLRRADRAGVREVWGCVTQDDIDATPPAGLLRQTRLCDR